MKTCVLIPLFNGEAVIGRLVREVVKYINRCFVVDDGSTDRTSKVASQAGALILRHERNLGKGASLRTGFDRVLKEGYDAVITMDGDGQHDPRDIPRFIEKAEGSSAGIILGDRMGDKENMPLIRQLTNKVMSSIISRICGQRIADSQCGYRLIKNELLKKLNLFTSRFEIESEVLIKASRLNFKVESIPITTIYLNQKSRIKPISDTIRFFKLLFWNWRRG